MALTSQQKMVRFRQRQKAAGRKELRGLFITDREEKILKPAIKERLRELRKGEKTEGDSDT